MNHDIYSVMLMKGEPGTFKDRMMMEKAPHQLIEGMIISAFAIGSKKVIFMFAVSMIFQLNA
jgi:NADH:ubiquinone oxidoreductase subunit F (NADH-binding)